MSTKSIDRRHAGLLLFCWASLLALTYGSFWLAEINIAPDAATASIVLGIAALKGHLIAGVFMEMLQAPRAWAVGMSLFLIALTGSLIALF